MIFYREMTPEEAEQLPVEQLRLAADVLSFATEELGINPNSELIWFESCSKDAAGSFQQSTGMSGDCEAVRLRVRIHTGLIGRHLIETLSHELRHAWQFANGHSPSWKFQTSKGDRERIESDAESYCKSFATRFYAKSPDRFPAGFGPDRNEIQNVKSAIANARVLIGRQ